MTVHLSDSAIVDIKNNYVKFSNEFGLAHFAKKYHVCQKTILSIVTGKWRPMRDMPKKPSGGRKKIIRDPLEVRSCILAIIGNNQFSTIDEIVEASKLPRHIAQPELFLILKAKLAFRKKGNGCFLYSLTEQSIQTNRKISYSSESNEESILPIRRKFLSQSEWSQKGENHAV